MIGGKMQALPAAGGVLEVFMAAGFSLLLTVTLFIMTGCMAPKPAPSLNLNYAPDSRNATSRTLTIGTVLPRYTGIMPVNDDTAKEIGPDETIAHMYTDNYALLLQNSIQADTEKILKAKGFPLAQPHQAFEELSPAEKQQTDLIAIITFDFMPEVSNNQRIFHYPTGGVRVVNEGTLRFTGTLKIALVEPLSKTKIMEKEINVGSFASNSPVEYEDQKESELKFIELLNTLYPRIMSNIEKTINAEQLQSALPTIKGLKEKNAPNPTENKTQ